MSNQRVGVVAACIALALVCVIVMAHKNDFIALVVVDANDEPIAVVDVESDGTGESSQSFRILAIRNDGTTRDVTLTAHGNFPVEAPFTYDGRGTVNARPTLCGDAWLVLHDQRLSVAVQVSVTRTPLIKGEREFGMLDGSDGDYTLSSRPHIYDPGEPFPWVQQDDGFETIHRPDEGPSVLARLAIGGLVIAIIVIAFILVQKPKHRGAPKPAFQDEED